MVFLLNFIVYYSITIIYQFLLYDFCFETLPEFDKRRGIYEQFKRQLPFFVYAFIAMIFEFFLIYEISKIVRNKKLINPTSLVILFYLLTSQIAKYDMYTDVFYIIENKNCNKTAIVIASGVILGLAILINFYVCFNYFKKLFFGRKTNYHSSTFVNYYSKLSFGLEMHAFGRILDKFSTSSASKYKFWFLPPFLYNLYIPIIIITTFIRLFIEDIPQIIIQIIALFVYKEKSLSNFSTLVVFITTWLNLLLTMHEAWNVKPSYFSRDLFKIYHDVLTSDKREVEEEEEDLQGDSFNTHEPIIHKQSIEKDNRDSKIEVENIRNYDNIDFFEIPEENLGKKNIIHNPTELLSKFNPKFIKGESEDGFYD